jgi:hypothetical protein
MRKRLIMNSKFVIEVSKSFADDRDFASKISVSELISFNVVIMTSYNSRNRHIASDLANQRVSQSESSLSCCLLAS